MPDNGKPRRVAVPHSDGVNGIRTGRPQASTRYSREVFAAIDVSRNLRHERHGSYSKFYSGSGSGSGFGALASSTSFLSSPLVLCLSCLSCFCVLSLGKFFRELRILFPLSSVPAARGICVPFIFPSARVTSAISPGVRVRWPCDRKGRPRWSDPLFQFSSVRNQPAYTLVIEGHSGTPPACHDRPAHYQRRPGQE